MATRRVGRPTLEEDVLLARKRAILDKTLGLVSERGPANVRLRDVAASSGVSVGLLQHYFDSRDQLLREAFIQHAYRVVDDIRRVTSAESPWGAIQGVVDNVFCNPSARERCSLWVEFVAAARQDDQLRELAAQVWASWRAPIHDAVVRGIADGTFVPTLDLDAAVTALLALIDGGEIAVTLLVEGSSAREIGAQVESAAGALLGIALPPPVRGGRTGPAVTQRAAQLRDGA